MPIASEKSLERGNNIGLIIDQKQCALRLFQTQKMGGQLHAITENILYGLR